MWRTSIEDPFMTHDSAHPHDLGWVLTRNGQSLLLREWQRGYVFYGPKYLTRLRVGC